MEYAFLPLGKRSLSFRIKHWAAIATKKFMRLFSLAARIRVFPLHH